MNDSFLQRPATRPSLAQPATHRAANRAVGILGIGTFLPPTVRGNDFWPIDFRPRDEEARRQDLLDVERTTRGERPVLEPEVAAAIAALGDDPFRGARLRHVIDDESEVSDMEAEAVRRALAAARVRPDEIDLILVSGLVSDRINPCNGPAIQAKCELVNAAAWGVEPGGCAGFQPQMVIATALVRAGFYRKILLVQSAAASRVVDFSQPMSTLWGDGAAACVVGEIQEGYGLLGHWMRTEGSLRNAVVYVPVVDGRPQPRWDRQAGPIRLTALDPDATKLAGRRGPEFCREACHGALAEAGLTMDDVDLYVGNQSLGWFVDACRRALGLPADKAIDTFAQVANLGPATVLYNLDWAHRQGRLRDGDIVLMYAPGAGLIRTATVYRWIDPSRAGVK